ncbi:UNVERIFIED_CONTAM: hypothetical protein RMT77_010552 [Armadillidium vulgare]
MSPEKMAESWPRNFKKYSCACGLSQDDKKRQFAGKCKHCHTRPKFLRTQSSFDSGSASRGANAEVSSPVTTPPGHTENLPNINEGVPVPSSSSGEVTVTGEPSSASDTATTSILSSLTFDTMSSSRRARGTMSATSSPSRHSFLERSTTLRNSLERPNLEATRRRSRSVDRYDIQQLLGDPPPYCTASENDRGRTPTRRSTQAVGVRRTESEDVGCRRSNREQRRSTPPPSYEAAQNPNPPSYEEALANQMSSTLSTSQGLSALIATTPDLRTSLPSTTGYLCRSSSLLSSFDHRRDTFRFREEDRRRRQSVTHRHPDRERQLERERELERDLEQERMRELQIAQYCGCSKCQSLYYNYYYDEAINDGSAFPMETQVIMQEVLADGLAFCSLM